MQVDFDIASDHEVNNSAQSLEYLYEFNYKSKEDIIFAVSDYHNTIGRKFIITKSDKRRYYVKCALENCGFYLKFNFRNQAFSAPSSGSIHTCSMLEVPQNNKPPSVKYLIRLPQIKSWFESESRNATTATLNKQLKSIGINVPYHTLLSTLRCLNMEYSTPPVVHKRRGRPKKRRIESQESTEELDTRPRRKYKCSQCQDLGHSKRQCRQQAE